MGFAREESVILGMPLLPTLHRHARDIARRRADDRLQIRELGGAPGSSEAGHDRRRRAAARPSRKKGDSKSGLGGDDVGGRRNAAFPTVPLAYHRR